MTDRYPRDLKGYGRTPPDPRWPGGARIAVQSENARAIAQRFSSIAVG